MEKETVDIFVDSCAVTHFNMKNENGYLNIGIKQTFEKVHGLLKTGGYFIITSDCVAERTDSIEFVEPQYWIDIASEYNMKLINVSNDTDSSNYDNVPFGFVYSKYNLKILRLMFQKV